MVELPSFSKQVVTSEPPRPAISPGEVAQPYKEMAGALDKLGQGLEAVATPLAERAGAEAVTRDADGKIQVERFPIFGLAGQAYTRAMKTAALAQADGDAKRQDIALREQFRDNPQGYAEAARAYKEKSVKDMTAAAGPEVGNALGSAIESTTTYTFRGLQNEKERLDLQRADNAISAGVNSASDDAYALARGGAKLDDPAMVQAMDKYSSLLQEKLHNPRLAYTQEQFNYDTEHFRGELAGQRFLYHNDQVYKTQGYQAAVDDAKSILTNPDYKLSEQQRQTISQRALSEVRINEGVRKQDINELHNAFYFMRDNALNGGRTDPDDVNKLRDGYASLGYGAGVARVDAFFANHDLNDGHGKLPLPDQTRDLNAIRGATAARQAYQFFTGRGYTSQQASGIVGNLISESATLNPMQIHDRGIGLGIAGWNNERLAGLRAYAASQGKPPTDFQTQLEYVDRELRTTESAAGARLRLAGTPEQAAAIMLTYERPKDFDIPGAHPERARNARALFNMFSSGQGAENGGPGVQSWLIANRSSQVSTEATKEWKQITDDFQSGKGAIPTHDKIMEIADAARSSGNVDLSAKIERDASIMDEVQRISLLPVAQQEATETELKRQMRLGSAFPGADMVEKILTDRTNAIRTGLEDNPIATSVTNLPDKFKTPPPLDFSNPQNLVAGLKQNAQIAQAAAEVWKSGPLSAIDKTDLPAVKAALANPDPNVKAGIYGAIATLPEDVRGATLRKLGGNEPAGMAEAAAGSLMATNPQIAASIFRGQAAMKTDKRLDPEAEDEGKKQYFADMDKALPASIFTLQDRTDPAGAFNTMRTMIKARYADLQAQSGQTAYSKDVLKQATTDVTGGVLSHNGGSFIAPVRGMDQTTFDGVLQSVTDNDLRGVHTLGGAPVTAEYLRSAAQLEGAGDGRYFVKLGKDPMQPTYAYQGTSKFVLDLRNRGAVPIPPTQYTPGP